MARSSRRQRREKRVLASVLNQAALNPIRIVIDCAYTVNNATESTSLADQVRHPMYRC